MEALIMKESNSMDDAILIESIDVEFCDVYFKAIGMLLGENNDNNMYGYLRRYFNLLRHETNSWCEFYYQSDDNNKEYINFLMETLFYRITYIFRNSILLSSAVAFHFQNILNENSVFLEKLLQKREVNICSLGGGPASDVVALVKVLDTIAETRGVELDIRVTVIDLDSDWKNTCFSVLRCLERFRNAITKVHFIQADLSKFYTAETLNAIQNADIVVMVKFLSEFVGYRKHTVKIVEEILRPGALLFLLDRPKRDIMKSCGDHSGKLENSDLIYEEASDLHVLDLQAIEKNFHLFHKHFGESVPNTCLKVFVRGWLKSNAIQPTNEVVAPRYNRFLVRREKYDGKRSVEHGFFGLSDEQFIEKMIKKGGTRSGLNIYISNQRQARNVMYVDLTQAIEAVESLRNVLNGEDELSETVSATNWEEYWRSKLYLAYLKKSIYCETVINFRGFLKSL